MLRYVYFYQARSIRYKLLVADYQYRPATLSHLDLRQYADTSVKCTLSYWLAALQHISCLHSAFDGNSAAFQHQPMSLSQNLCAVLVAPHCKRKSYFNHICRLSQLHQSDVSFHLSEVPFGFTTGISTTTMQPNPFPEMLIDRCCAKKTGLIKREASQCQFDFKVLRRLV